MLGMSANQLEAMDGYVTDIKHRRCHDSQTPVIENQKIKHDFFGSHRRWTGAG